MLEMSREARRRVAKDQHLNKTARSCEAAALWQRRIGIESEAVAVCFGCLLIKTLSNEMLL